MHCKNENYLKKYTKVFQNSPKSLTFLRGHFFTHFIKYRLVTLSDRQDKVFKKSFKLCEIIFDFKYCNKIAIGHIFVSYFLSVNANFHFSDAAPSQLVPAL